MAADTRSNGPECAVLTSLGTLYLYRLTSSDLAAFRALPGTKLSSDKFRVLLTRIASTQVSEKGILDAGTVTADQVESLSDDEIERIAESYLDGTTIRWYRHEGASATISVIRQQTEPATKFIDRLVNWYVMRGPGSKLAAPPDVKSTTGTYPRPRMVPQETIVLTRREAWIALAALGLLAVLGIGAFLQHYLLVQSLQKRQDALLMQVKETNAMLGAQALRASQDNAQLRARIDSLEAALHPRAIEKPREARAAPAAERAREPAKSRSSSSASKSKARH